MNDEAVYRTAPATPGLLNIEFFFVWNYQPNKTSSQNYIVKGYFSFTMLKP